MGHKRQNNILSNHLLNMRLSRTWRLIIPVVGTGFFILIGLWCYRASIVYRQSPKMTPTQPSMMNLIQRQLSFGARHIGMPGHEALKGWIVNTITPLVDDVLRQPFGEGENIIARVHPEIPRRFIIGTHFDTKKYANNDPRSPTSSVPGANDGASGVAVLLELARRIDSMEIAFLDTLGIDIVFFDGEEWEEQYNSGKWAPLGSTYFASQLHSLYGNTAPVGAVIVDMVCDNNLQLAMDRASLSAAPDQTRALWKIGHEIAPTVFSDIPRYEIQDDHTPLNAVGIPSTLMIDFDYPAFHTTMDTIDQCSEQSLGIVAETVSRFLGGLKD